MARFFLKLLQRMCILFISNMAEQQWLELTHGRFTSCSGELACLSLIADTPSSDLLRYFLAQPVTSQRFHRTLPNVNVTYFVFRISLAELLTNRPKNVRSFAVFLSPFPVICRSHT